MTNEKLETCCEVFFFILVCNIKVENFTENYGIALTLNFSRYHPDVFRKIIHCFFSAKGSKVILVKCKDDDNG